MSKSKNPFRFIFKASVSSVIMAAVFLLFWPLSVKAAPENTDYGCRFAEGSGPRYITVTAIAARQGEQCMSTIEAALDGYTLADTYNITLIYLLVFGFCRMFSQTIPFACGVTLFIISRGL